MDLETGTNYVSKNLEQETPACLPKCSEKSMEQTNITTAEASDLEATHTKKKKKKKSKNKVEKLNTENAGEQKKNSTIVNESTGNNEVHNTKQSPSISLIKDKNSKEKNSVILKSKNNFDSSEGSTTTQQLPEPKKKKKKAKHKTKTDEIDTKNSNEPETLQIVKKHKTKKGSKNEIAHDNLVESNQCSSTSSESIDKNATQGNLFSMNEDWDEPLKEGESEIFVANPKYTGNAISPTSPLTTPLQAKKKKAGKEKSSSDEVFGTPSITTPDKLPTPIFVKKAISKSGIETKVKKQKKGNIIHSEPKKPSGDKSKRHKIGKSLNI